MKSFSLFGVSLLVMGFVFLMSSSGVMAFDIASLDEDLNDAFFDGDSLIAAQIVLAAMVVLMATIVLGVVHTPPLIMLVVDVLLIAMVTAIGWLDPGVFIALLVIVALLFANILRKQVWSEGE
jgi:hypothetical protein